MVNSLSDKYGGEAKFLLDIKDGDEIVLNALVTVNPDIVLKFEPIKNYTGDYDAKIMMDFDFFYNLISTTEKEVRGGETIYPPWESGFKIGDVIKGAVDGVRMWLMITSASITGEIKAEPSNAMSDGLDILHLLFKSGH